MKILYSIQATGNGHISRAMELVPYLQAFGKTDLFLSGANSSLHLDAPVAYRSKGLSLFYTCKGNLDYGKLFRSIDPWRIYQEARQLPVEKYDVVINDFECITSIACALKKVPSVHFGHQASFLSDRVPRPENKSRIGEWVLKNYAKAQRNIGLHFESYDDFILSPVIKQEILNAAPEDHGHITVYLPAYCEPQLIDVFSKFTDYRFEIFIHQARRFRENGNITILPVDKNPFNNSLIHCHGIITGGGFETPAEALYLQKKLIVIPIKGQYEQQCNAAALKKLGVTITDTIIDNFTETFNNWISDEKKTTAFFPHSTQNIVDQLMFAAIESRDWEPLNS